jgi:hypothetical protein
MAYLRKLERPKCCCGKPATVELINRYNASCGQYCARCGARAHKQLCESEKAQAAGR